jgi:hypothetical protein
VNRLVALLLIVLTPVLVAPGCGSPYDRHVAPDSKRGLRKSNDLDRALIVKDGDKLLPQLSIRCQQVATGAPGTPVPPGTLKTDCGPVDGPDSPETLDIRPGQKFRILTGAPAEAVSIYRVPVGDPRGREVRLPAKWELARGAIGDKAGLRWDLRLRAPIDYSLVRIMVTPTSPKDFVAGFDLAIDPGDQVAP